MLSGLKDPDRRKTIGTFGMKQPTPSKTPSKQRFSLGNASNYYFKGPKTPVQKEIAAIKQMNSSMMSQNLGSEVNDSVDGVLASYDGSYSAAESSFISSASSSSAESDLLNQTTLSDTHELTASMYVRAASSRQRLSDKHAPEPTFFMAAPSPREENIMQHARASVPRFDEAVDRKPLGILLNDQRRKSLPGPLAFGGSNSSAAAPVIPNNRRQSLPGPAPSSLKRKEKPSPATLIKLSAELKTKRLEREQQMDEEFRRRLSAGSNNSFALKPPSQASSSKPSTPREDTTVSLSVKFSPIAKSSEKSQRPEPAEDSSSDEEDVLSRRSLQKLFDDVPRTQDGDVTASDIDSTDFRMSTGTDQSRLSRAQASIQSEKTAFSDASPASTISTKTGVSRAPPVSENTSPHPRPLPEAIAFEPKDYSRFRAEATSPFKYDKSVPEHQALTPTKLEPSPRKPNLAAIDSPARRTRSAEKRRKEQEAIANESAADLASENRKRRRSSVSTASALTSSLRKTKRANNSARKVNFGSPEMIEFNKHSPSASVTPARMKSGRARLADAEDVTVPVEADMTELLKQTSTNAMDAGNTPFVMKKTTDENDLSMDSDVGSHKSEDKASQEDVTVPIEVDMATLLNQTNASIHGTSQGQLRPVPSADSFMSVDSSVEDETAEVEHTVALEVNMDQLFENAEANAITLATNHKPVRSVDEDATMELEQNMTELLGMNAVPSQSVVQPEANGDISQQEVVTQQPFQSPEDDVTMELERDMTELLGMNPVVAAPSSLVKEQRRRSSISSRRLSLVPERRFSLQSITSPKPETSVAESPLSEKIQFDLKDSEVADVAVTKMTLQMQGMSDLINEVCATASGHGVGVMSTCLSSVVQALEENSDDPDLTNVMSIGDGADEASLLSLQQALRSDEESELGGQFEKLVESIAIKEQHELLKWSLSVVESLEESLGAELAEVSDLLVQAESDNHFVDERHTILSVLETSAAQKARRKSLDRRKVRGRMRMPIGVSSNVSQLSRTMFP